MFLENLFKAYDEPCFVKKNSNILAVQGSSTFGKIDKQRRKAMKTLMMIAMMMMIGLLMALTGCNEHLSYDDSNNNNTNNVDVNNNDNDTNNDNQNDTVPPQNTTFRIRARSSDQLAVWAQIETGEPFFGPLLTIEDCGGENAGYDFNLKLPSVFLISASSELWVEADVNVDLYTINQAPEDQWSFWTFEMQLKNFYMLPAYWHVERFPESLAQAEGFKYSSSAFICGMGLDMINQGCSNAFEDNFFEPRGSSRSFYFEEGQWGEIFVLGVLR